MQTWVQQSSFTADAVGKSTWELHGGPPYLYYAWFHSAIHFARGTFHIRNIIDYYLLCE